MLIYERENKRVYMHLANSPLGVVAVIQSRRGYKILFQEVVTASNLARLEDVIWKYFNAGDAQCIVGFCRRVV